MFPTPMLQLGLHPQVEVEVALARAYNRWLAERVLAHEPRIRSMLYLPFNDPDARYRMVKEFAGKKGVVGFMVTSARYRPVHHNSYMKTYALMEEIGLPLAFHAGYNWNEQSMGMMNRFISVHALGFVLYNMVHMTNWVINGLPERFPEAEGDLDRERARLAAVHDPAARQRIHDALVGSAGAEEAAERIHRRHVLHSQPMEMHRHGRCWKRPSACIKAETQLLYSSDYPHWDFDLPSTIYDLPFLNEKAKRNILGGNAIRLFDLKLPAGKLAKVA